MEGWEKLKVAGGGWGRLREAGGNCERLGIAGSSPMFDTDHLNW